MRWKAVIPLVLAALITACGDPSGPAGEPEVDLSFDIQRPPNEPAMMLAGGEQAVKVRGNFDTPCTGTYTATAEARRSGAELTLRIAARKPSPACLTMTDTFGYEATVRGLPAGRYHLRVVHDLEGSAAYSRVAADAQVVVR